ncbi:MAG: hypothetical protein M3Z32_09320 [Acidobacteriota bacterium]|nr:hypothetical protein [Acidobacteriota bacterium]
MSLSNWLARILLGSFCLASLLAQPARPPAPDPQVDRMLAREADLLKSLGQVTPVVETYISGIRSRRRRGTGLRTDHYFLGKVSIGQDFRFLSLLPSRRTSIKVPASMHFEPAGLAQTLTPDPVSWNRATYNFESVRTEFLGEVRCLVFDVSPIQPAPGKFIGRIWGGSQFQHRALQRHLLHSG